MYKPTTQCNGSPFIATHTDKKDLQNIKSPPQNDNTLFGQIWPIVNPTYTWSSFTWQYNSTHKLETLNNNINKTVTVDKNISADDAVLRTIHFIVTTPAKGNAISFTVTLTAKKNDISLKIFKSNNSKKNIYKLEAQLSAIKSNIESILNEFHTRIKTFEGGEKLT